MTLVSGEPREQCQLQLARCMFLSFYPASLLKWLYITFMFKIIYLQCFVFRDIIEEVGPIVGP